MDLDPSQSTSKDPPSGDGHKSQHCQTVITCCQLPPEAPQDPAQPTATATDATKVNRPDKLPGNHNDLRTAAKKGAKRSRPEEGPSGAGGRVADDNPEPGPSSGKRRRRTSAAKEAKCGKIKISMGCT